MTAPLLSVLLGLEVDRGGLALLAALELEADLLALVQAAQAGALDRRNMHEDILRPVIRLDEPITLLPVEPLHRSGWHRKPFHDRWPPSEFGWRINLWRLREAGSGLSKGTKCRPNL